jgi:hypothetical protein
MSQGWLTEKSVAEKSKSEVEATLTGGFFCFENSRTLLKKQFQNSQNPFREKNHV